MYSNNQIVKEYSKVPLEIVSINQLKTHHVYHTIDQSILKEGQYVALRCSQKFPANVKVELKIGPSVCK